MDCLVTRENNTLRTWSAFTRNQHSLTAYLNKRLTILLYRKRIQYETWREEHKLLVTQTTVWLTKPSPWTLFLLQKNTAKTSSNAILTSDRTTALTTHTQLKLLYGMYEGLPKRIQRLYNVCVPHKPKFTALPCLLTNVKDQRPKTEDIPGAVYEIKCSDCQATHIGETGRNLTTNTKRAQTSY